MPVQEPMWETDYWIVILAEDQTYLGRSVVILKRQPCVSLSELHDDELFDLKNNVMIPYEAALKQVFGAEMFNWSCLMNNAYQNTPPNPYMHWHVKPRYRNPVTIDGEAFIDDEFGHHYTPSTSRILSPEIRRSISDKICSARAQL